jgi:hypothetical protein
MNKKLSIILIGSLGIVAFFLIFEHRAHIFGNIQYVLFVLFIGLHLVMHLGHGGHGNHNDHEGHKKGGSHG